MLNFDKSHPELKKAIRRWCKSNLNGYCNNIRIEILPNSHYAPNILGRSFRYETRGGTIIKYPSAYRRSGWGNMVYRPSTKRIEVGELWISEHFIKEYFLSVILQQL